MSERGEAVDRARAAVAAGEWQEATRLLDSLRDKRQLSPDELDLYGRASYGAGEFEAAITAWEQAHRAQAEAGDLLGAAESAVTVAMYLMMDTGLMAPVRGWLACADRLLAGADEAPVHAWQAMVSTYERLLSGDVPAAERHATMAIEIGIRQGTLAPLALGQVAKARLSILDGDVDNGLALLDEAAVTTVSGDLDALSAGMVYCELICAMQGLAQFEQAEQWTEAMQRWRGDHAFGSMNGRCRVHRAELLRLRGSCDAAETEALRACEELRPWMRRELGWPLTELGTIRLRKGDLAGAEQALLAAHECGWDPQPSLAMLRLEHGEVDTAYTLICDAVARPRRVPFKERPPYGSLPRAPIVEAQVEIALAAGDTVVAERAASDLAEIASLSHSRAHTAGAALAQGRLALARGDAHAAATACDEAVSVWSEVGAPYEAAVARMVLAAAHRANGSDDLAQLELRAARATFERHGATLKAEQAARLCRDQVPTPASPGAPPAGVFRRDGDMRTLEFAGTKAMIKDLKGMRYIAHLLAEPGREFHVLDLVAAERGASEQDVSHGVDELSGRTYEGDLGPVLDEQAVAAYKRRLVEVEDDLDEARRDSDTTRVEQATLERDFLVAELSRAFGVGGRHRPTGSAAERARVSVARSIRYALKRIEGRHPTLAEHLRHALHTGIYCSYTPDPRAPRTWLQ